MPKWKKLKSQKKNLKWKWNRHGVSSDLKVFFLNYHIFLIFFREVGGGAWVEEGFFISGEVFFVLKLTKSKQYFFRIC